MGSKVWPTKELEKGLGRKFRRPQLLEEARIHSSLRIQEGRCNERLEFLGDAILDLIVAEELFKGFPDLPEGEMTRIRAAIVSRESLARECRRLKLLKFLIVDSSVRRRDMPDSFAANFLEALIGALYLDGGKKSAREFALSFLEPCWTKVMQGRHQKNFKSMLQQFCQKIGWGEPRYQVKSSSGPQHRRIFHIEVSAKNGALGSGSGSTKKAAQQEAAASAVRYLRKGKKSWRQLLQELVG